MLDGVIVHEPTDRRRLTPQRRQGLRCTNILRTLVDLGAVDTSAVHDAVGHALATGLANLAAIQTTVIEHSRQGRSGVVALREALAEWTIDAKPADSVLEIAMRRLIRRYALPPVTFHPTIEGYEVDFVVTGTPVILECDGWASHGLIHANFERDRARDADLTAKGWIVIRFTYRAITMDPEGDRRTLPHRRSSGGRRSPPPPRPTPPDPRPFPARWRSPRISWSGNRHQLRGDHRQAASKRRQIDGSVPHRATFSSRSGAEIRDALTSGEGDTPPGRSEPGCGPPAFSRDLVAASGTNPGEIAGGGTESPHRTAEPAPVERKTTTAPLESGAVALEGLPDARGVSGCQPTIGFCLRRTCATMKSPTPTASNPRAMPVMGPTPFEPVAGRPPPGVVAGGVVTGPTVVGAAVVGAAVVGAAVVGAAVVGAAVVGAAVVGAVVPPAGDGEAERQRRTPANCRAVVGARGVGSRERSARVAERHRLLRQQQADHRSGDG